MTNQVQPVLPDYYWLECKYSDGRTSKYVATWEIISGLYERAYKECLKPANGWVDAVGSPQVYEQDLITHDKKLMILGSGRSGTTFIVKLLTRLGLYTGYCPYGEVELGDTRGGCEFGIFSFGAVNQYLSESQTSLDTTHIKEVFEEFITGPFIIKSPSYSWYIKLLIVNYKIPIGHIFVPVRDHREVARSRIKERLELLITPNDYDSQILACDILLGRCVEAAILADIPITFTRFPDIVTDEAYCWDKLNSVLSETYDIHLDRDRFRQEFQQLSDPSIIKYSARKLT